MKERLIVIPLPALYPGAAAALGNGYAYFMAQCDMTIVGVSAAPSADDADLTLDINDDGAAVIAALSCADADVPGEWQAKGFGGTNEPVYVAAGSKISLDANGAAAGTTIMGYIYALVGESVG